MMTDHTAGLSDRDLADLRALGALARAGVDDKRDDAWIADVDLAAVAGQRGARQLALATVFSMVGVLGASVGIALFMSRSTRDVRTGEQARASAPAAPLAYTVERLAGGAASTAAATPDAAESRYLFVDGTTVSTTAEAAISVDAAAAARPRVRLMRGRVRVRVVHHDGRQWTFHAGPYDVRVTGTAFDLTWDGGAGRLALHMREGAVEVRGPGLAAPARVRAGQDLAATLDGAPAITATSLAPTNGPDPDGRPPASEHASRGRAAAPGRGESWRTLVGRGAFAAVLAQARERPLAACLLRCSSDELRALGDAARYSRRPALATRALEALRRRFPATPDGAAATFLLGRTAEAQGHWKDAGAWYARYLEEAPTGEFSVEAAAGRARAATEAVGGSGVARPPAGRDRSMN